MKIMHTNIFVELIIYSGGGAADEEDIVVGIGWVIKAGSRTGILRQTGHTAFLLSHSPMQSA